MKGFLYRRPSNKKALINRVPWDIIVKGRQATDGNPRSDSGAGQNLAAWRFNLGKFKTTM